MCLCLANVLRSAAASSEISRQKRVMVKVKFIEFVEELELLAASFLLLSLLPRW